MTDEPTRSIDAPTARRFLVTRHLLAPPRSAPPSPDGVAQVVSRLGSVQFDPLAVAGRNHDLVLHARVRDYESAWTDHLLYDRRELFEIWNKGLSLVPTAELPWFRVFWDRHATSHEEGILARSAATREHVLARISTEGPLTSLDFEPGPRIDWYWGPTRETRAVLEALVEAGVLALARRDGNRRSFDLTSRLFAAELLDHRPTEREQRRHKLLSRYRANGLLGAGGQAELWLGIGKAKRNADMPPDEIVREELRADLVADGEIWPVEVEGLKGVRYVLGEELDLLDEIDAAGELTTDPAVTFLAPLDPLVWDRDLLRGLFGFDYVWEVYVPEHKRIWGYYVLPILFGDRLVGRFEPRFDRASGSLRVLNAWWEPRFDPAKAEGFVPAMRDALAAYVRMGRVRTVDWAPALGRERRLFGIQPGRPTRPRKPATALS